jgi:Putative conjugal transfer nickase/helicase TraI C-term
MNSALNTSNSLSTKATTTPLFQGIAHSIVLGTTRVGKSIFTERFYQFLTRKSTDKDQPIVVLDTQGETAALEQAPRKTKKKHKPQQNANAFLDWLHAELEFGSVTHNQADSMVHFVPQGILLRSPQIFKDFLKYHDAIGLHIKPTIRLKILQRELQKSGYLLFNLTDSSYFHRYELCSELDNKNNYSGKTACFYLVENNQIQLSEKPSFSSCVRAAASRDTIASHKHPVKTSHKR